MNVGKIALSQFFFSTELESREARQRIKDELSGFCVVTEAPKTTFGKVFLAQHRFAPPLRSQTKPLGLPGSQDLHRQALRQAGRPLHRATIGDHRSPKVSPRSQVPWLPQPRLRDRDGARQQPAAARRRVGVCFPEGSPPRGVSPGSHARPASAAAHAGAHAAGRMSVRTGRASGSVRVRAQCPSARSAAACYWLRQ